MATKITVDAKALRSVLNAVVGPPHYIRELVVIRTLGTDNPIDNLITSYNDQIDRPTMKENMPDGH